VAAHAVGNNEYVGLRHECVFVLLPKHAHV
jgi:hypothetical protein